MKLSVLHESHFETSDTERIISIMTRDIMTYLRRCAERAEANIKGNLIWEVFGSQELRYGDIKISNESITIALECRAYGSDTTWPVSGDDAADIQKHWDYHFGYDTIYNIGGTASDNKWIFIRVVINPLYAERLTNVDPDKISDEITIVLDHELGHFKRPQSIYHHGLRKTHSKYFRHSTEWDPNIQSIIDYYNRLPEKPTTYTELMNAIKPIHPELVRSIWSTPKWRQKTIKRLQREGIVLDI
jgi:hypothetical protein